PRVVRGSSPMAARGPFSLASRHDLGWSSCERKRPDSPLRRGRGRRGCAARCHARRSPGRARRRHGAVRLRQVHPDAPSRGPRQADVGHRADRRRGRRLAFRQGRDDPPPAAHRLRLPVLQPAADAERGGERAAAALDRRREAGTRVLRADARPRPPQRPPHAPPGGALGRPAAARRDRTRARVPADGRLRRRADRQPRLEDRRRDPRAAPPQRRGARADDGDGDARRARGRDRRPRDVPRRRQDRRGAAALERGRHPGRDEPRSRMTRVALAGILGRKLRTVLTALAVILGVAMVSGTFVLTDSIQKAFTAINNEVRAGSDVVVSGKSAFDLSNGGQGSFAPTVPASLLQRLRAIPDVEEAQGSVQNTSTSLVLHGKTIAFGGAPNLGFSVVGGSQFNPLTLVTGTWPHGDEVVIDSGTASKKHLHAGDTIGVQVLGPVERFRIAGTVKLGGSAGIGGATLAGFDLATAQRLFQKQGRFDEIALAGKPGVSPEKLLGEVKPVLPAHAQARTGKQQAAKDTSDTDSFISFLRDFLVAFGGIALFVGSFVIANSLSITIAQRTRELATLRTLGASRRQVLNLIFVEAFVLGVLASITGLFAGLGLAELLFKLFNAVGFTLPNSGIVFATRTIVISLVAGILVTLVASLRPAFRATRVEPIAAVREGATLPPSRFARYRSAGSAVLTLLGFAALLLGLFVPHLGTTAVLTYMGVGALLIFIGVSLLSVRFIRPLAWALGWPATRIGGTPGSLARDNARRNPQRTASTAAALMIGLALVTLVAVLAAGITQSFRGAVDKIWRNADYAITAQNNFSPIPTSAADAAAKSPAVDAVTNVRTGEALAFGSSFFATAVNPAGA